MGILANAAAIGIVCVRERGRAKLFYRDVLGLALVHEDDFAAVFGVGGISIRVSTVPGFTPHEHTVMGFKVTDIAETVKALTAKGVAWFKDPDGNVLSVTQFG